MKKTLMLVLALSGFAGAMTETVVISDFTWTIGVNTTYSESLTSGIGAANGYTFASTDSPAPGIKQIVSVGSVASGMPANTVNSITLNIAWD